MTRCLEGNMTKSRKASILDKINYNEKYGLDSTEWKKILTKEEDRKG